MTTQLRTAIAELLRAKVDLDNATVYVDSLNHANSTPDQRQAAAALWRRKFDNFAIVTTSMCLAAALVIELEREGDPS